MTIAQAFLDTLYSNKDGKITGYSIKGLDILKPCLVRYNKGSKNGIALTICDAVSTKYESKVSKKNTESGVKPVSIEAGGTLTFDINAQSMKDGKVAEGAGQIEAVIKLIEGAGIKEGEIFLLSCDIGAVPDKGIDEKYHAYLKATGDDAPFFKPARFTSDEELTALCETHGLDPVAWLERFTALSGLEYKEQQGYAPRKTYGELLMERVLFFKSTTQEQKDQILEVCTLTTTEEDGTVTVTVPDFGAFVFAALTSL